MRRPWEVIPNRKHQAPQKEEEETSGGGESEEES